MCVNMTLTIVITTLTIVITTHSSVIYLYTHECDYSRLDTQDCDFNTHKSVYTQNLILSCMSDLDFDIHECDFNTHKSDFYTQSVMLSRISVILTLTSVFYTRRV
jgi:hypothetical protein